MKIYYKNNCLTTHLQRFNVTSFDNGYLDAKSCGFTLVFDNNKERDDEYELIIKDIKKSKKYKNIKVNYSTKGHLDEIQFKSLDNAIYSNTFINIEMYKKEQSDNGKYQLNLLVEIDE